MRTEWIPYLLVMAITTYLVRMLPLALFRKQIRSRFAKSFFYYVPYAVLSVMTIPAILFATPHIISSATALVVAVFFAYRGKSLLIVATGSSVTVFICELIFKLL